MQKAYKNCQSCSMPLKQDPKGGGTEADGSQSAMYCSYCYENGAFVQADWTAAQMQTFVTGKMKEMGMPGFLAKFFSMSVPRLKRWNP